MSKIPEWDVRAFECEVEPLHLTVTGNVTHIARDGWKHENIMYLVEACVRGRWYKFNMVQNEDVWMTSLLSVYMGRDKLHSVHTFQMSNERLEYLFEEAVINLANRQPEPDEQ